MQKIAIFDQGFLTEKGYPLPRLVKIVDTFDEVAAVIAEEFPGTTGHVTLTIREDVEDMFDPSHEGCYFSVYSIDEASPDIAGSVFAEYIDFVEGVDNYITLQVYGDAEEVLCNCTSDIEVLRATIAHIDDELDISSIVNKVKVSGKCAWGVPGGMTVSIFKI